MPISCHSNNKVRKGFYPNLKGIIVNPYYFARKGLYESIKKCSPYIAGRILDIGCGNKPYQHLFNYSDYIGLDYDKGGSNSNPHAEYLYDGSRFPFDNSTFDACISTQVFEHVFEPNAFLDEANRVLKAGGVLLLTVPFVWDEHEQPYDYARYSSFGLVALLEKHGFKIVIQMKSISDIRVIFQLLNTYIQKVFMKNKNNYLKTLLITLFFSSVNIVGSVLYHILPANNDLYLDNVIVARKGEE